MSLSDASVNLARSRAPGNRERAQAAFVEGIRPPPDIRPDLDYGFDLSGHSRHRYVPAATVSSIEQFLAVVKADQYGCFFG